MGANIRKEIKMIDTYGKPSDVIEIDSYEATLENAVAWAKARGINEMEYSRTGLQYNVATERLEGAEATVKLVKAYGEDNEEGVIESLFELVDSIVDACIFVLVDTCKIGWVPSELGISMVDRMELPARSAILDPASSAWFYKSSPYLYYVLTCRELIVLGFDPDLCFTEAFKEISTRRGKYNKATNKWHKEPVSLADEYKADYSKCVYELDKELIDTIHKLNGFRTNQDSVNDFKDLISL